LLLPLEKQIMPVPAFGEFLSGRTTYRPSSSWHPLLAVLAVAMAIAVGQAVPVAVLTWWSPDAIVPTVSRPGEMPLQPVSEGFETGLLLLGQAVLAIMAVGLARWHGGRPMVVLGLGRPDDGGWAFLYALITMVPLLAIVNGLAYWLSPEGFAQDFQQFRAYARSADPILPLISVGIGAPLWEELLFRGFLIAPLAIALGFLPAALLVSGSWAMLHIGYSMAGLAEVFLIGIYFSWLLWRTGSLWVPIVCHAAYNVTLFLALRFLPV
jgi:membrane protease YdiL (CAAX protease family)